MQQQATSHCKAMAVLNPPRPKTIKNARGFHLLKRADHDAIENAAVFKLVGELHDRTEIAAALGLMDLITIRVNWRNKNLVITHAASTKSTSFSDDPADAEEGLVAYLDDALFAVTLPESCSAGPDEL